MRIRVPRHDIRIVRRLAAAVGIGGDPITGMSYTEVLDLFDNDDETKAIVLIGEIGGCQEEKAADYIREKISKPVFAFIAGSSIDLTGKRFGHAGALIAGSHGTAKSKKKALEAAGVTLVDHPFQLEEAIFTKLGR